MALIRKAARTDAEQLVKVMENAEKSGNMLFNPGERTVSSEAFADYIEAINSKEKSGLFVACENGRVLGYLIAQNDTPQRIAHRAYIVIGVHKDSRGKDIGSNLFIHLEEWAKKAGLHRLDLTVLCENKAAVGLYQKMGFEIEGTKRDSLLIGDRFVDEYYMSKLV
ncbi:GNAT family N-acetyltransferase [Planomicrobium sp. CPCC 101110]|uniref:GNAT family N-acetyltransferase n=1 Tax=Planomicrobium sp. CPCC 101110 TaxID=2599619 RepID=UPI0011B7FBC3|nr:GNAT family N-acetyltransferase [Planomicrobium sp. CPCC 101110]TWT25978.1 GNAT family N-acetyltransferase [Planomicrobium sp. CPCC 101110]